MNTKHTLGPWHIGMHPGPIIYGADSSQVADCRGDLLGKDESLANLRLIASAPDLLAECERLRAVCAQLVSALDGALNVLDATGASDEANAAREALERAKGQS